VSDAPETPPRVDPAAVARLLRQRTELADVPLYLGDGTRAALLADLEALRGGAAARPVRRPPPGPSAGERRAARGGDTTELPVVPDAPVRTLDYDALREAAMGCTRCGLHETRTNVVFSDGNPDARLVVVGEAPGANEDASGLPFVGAAGKLLDLMLASVDLSREDSVYICNVLKCRPPGNRNPEAGEIEQCAPFLKRQLALVKPEALLAVGTFAAQLLTGRDRPLGRLRGEVHAYEGIPLVVTYHPAALLRNSGWVRPTWDDLQLLRQVMDG
jgi:DNA polymerase